MNDHSAADKQDVKLQNKLVRTLKHQNEMLASFIIRLSNFYAGMNTRIDNELKVLRQHLGGRANFALAEVSIGKLTGLLMEHGELFKKHDDEAKRVLESAAKELITSEHLPESLMGDITGFLAALKRDSVSLFTSLPRFEGALKLYAKALENTATRKRIINQQPHNQYELNKNAKLHQQISFELKELINQLAITPQADKNLATIRMKLDRGISHDELLECCLVVIRAVLEDVVSERKHAEEFVSNLHESLGKVSCFVSDSLDNAESQFEAKKAANEQLKGHVQVMGSTVESAKDLELLKQQASELLAKMSQSIESRANSDHEEQTMLMDLLSNMKEQLTSLESETSDYKHRLLEQRYQSHHDSLTQIANRSAYNERIELEYKRWQRHQSPLSIALLDVDLFKRINDTFGHAAGDKTLQVIAQNISRALRNTDFIARWGGEEFIVIFPDTATADLAQPLENIRRKIERIPFKFKEENVTMTVSAGATEFTQNDTIEAAFERADAALYEAKNSGRNRCIITEGK